VNRGRSDSSQRARRAAVTVDLVGVALRPRGLAVLTVSAPRARPSRGRELPWAAPRPGEALDVVARRLARGLGLPEPPWLEQVAAFGHGRHPSGASVSVCYLAITPPGGTKGALAAVPARQPFWMEQRGAGSLGSRQRAMVDAAMAMLPLRMDYSPIPFRLLPDHFTLGELQHVYELLLGRTLHKASFRRALHSAWLVEPTDEWRSDGRGRPAQLFRFAPRKRRAHRRALRFDLVAR
jgi:8-oxo-dGTP diphosphatase